MEFYANYSLYILFTVATTNLCLSSVECLVPDDALTRI
jgi:hypothetical protein